MNLPITYRLKQQQNTQNFKTVAKVIQRKIDKVSKLFSYIAKNLLRVLLQSCFKKAGIQFKRINVLRNEDE